MGLVDGPGPQFMHPVEHVAKVALGIDAGALNPAHDLADQLLPHRRLRPTLQPLEVGQQFGVDEGKEDARGLALQGHAHCPARCRPIAPAVGRIQ
jgi:hypothetical protein